MKTRQDIEGLRALSIGLVVAYHYFPTAVPGGYVGVDAFFVISGFLITHTLLALSAQGLDWRATLLEFWARRARRLLPNALLVLAACVVVGLLLLSEYSRKKLGSDIFWSAYYAVNWLYVLRATDYLQWDENRLGVLLNFWSLAVEEQFYLLWPLVVLAVCRGPAADAAARLPRLARVSLLLGAASMVYGLALAQGNLTLAFFSSPARFWELLVGAALAASWAPRAAAPSRGWGELLAMGGLVLLVAAGLAFSDETRHPGLITLWPVLGCALVIAAARWWPDSLAARLLAWAPLQYLGSRSYALYLWHWPILVVGRHLAGDSTPTSLLLSLALSLLAAELSWRLVETPARFRWGQGWSARRVLALALLGSSLAAAAGFGLRAMSVNSPRELVALKPGTSALGRQLPPLSVIEKDLPITYAKGCHLALDVHQSGPCEFGDVQADERVVLFGDSHAAQWFPALDEVALRQQVRLVAWTKSSCPSVDVSVWNQIARSAFAQCDTWRRDIMARLRAQPPRRVILSNLIEEPLLLVDRGSGRLLRGREALQAWRLGLERTIAELREAGIEVVVIRDNPRPRPDVLDCLYSAASADKCSLSVAEATASPKLDVEAARAAGALVWDFTPQICPGGSCPAVVGGPPWTLVYRDSNHLSAGYVRSLAPVLESRWHGRAQ